MLCQPLLLILFMSHFCFLRMVDAYIRDVYNKKIPIHININRQIRPTVDVNYRFRPQET